MPTDNDPIPKNLAEASAMVGDVEIRPLLGADGEPEKEVPKSRRTGRKAPSRPSASSRKMSTANLEKQCVEWFGTVGLFVCAVNPADGMVIIEDAEKNGKALAAWAESNPKVRRIIEGGLSGSAMIGFILAISSTGLKIAANHNVDLSTIVGGIRGNNGSDGKIDTEPDGGATPGAVTLVNASEN